MWLSKLAKPHLKALLLNLLNKASTMCRGALEPEAAQPKYKVWWLFLLVAKCDVEMVMSVRLSLPSALKCSDHPISV